MLDGFQPVPFSSFPSMVVFFCCLHKDLKLVRSCLSFCFEYFVFHLYSCLASQEVPSMAVGRAHHTVIVRITSLAVD